MLEAVMRVASNECNCRDLGRRVSRRGFVRDLLRAGSGLAAVAVCGGAGAAEGPRPQTGAESGEPQGGYRETAHVRDYYRTASL